VEATTTMSTTKARRVIPLTPVDDRPISARVRRSLRISDQHARDNARTQIAYHGPGRTFGELAIGECFTWPPPMPRGSEPIVKVDATHYAWSRGRGTAESFYRVETWELPA
jgi:hypothetical protein